MNHQRAASLAQAKAEWARVQSDFAYLRVVFAAARYREVLRRDQRSNPNHDELGRFTSPSGSVASGTGGGNTAETPATGNGNSRVAFLPAAPIAVEKVAEAAIFLYTYLASRNSATSTAILEFHAREFLPGAAKDDPAIGARTLNRDEVDASCPRHNEVQKLTNEAVIKIEGEGNYWGASAKGTLIHTAIRNEVIAINDPNFRAEVSTIKSKEADYYGQRGSIRVDILENVGDGSVCVYDIKTGVSGLSLPRMQEIASNVHSFYPGTKRVLVIETRPK